MRGRSPVEHGGADGPPEFVRLQRRRRTALETVALVVPIAVAVLASGLLVADWPLVASLLWALVSGLIAMAYWMWHRGRYPAVVDPPTPEPPRARAERHEDAGPIWHPVNLLVLAVGAVVVVSFALVGMVAALLLPLLIILGFGIADGWSDPGALGIATLCVAAVAVALEFALLIPLSKRWGLPVEATPRRSDFCPPREDRTP